MAIIMILGAVGAVGFVIYTFIQDAAKNKTKSNSKSNAKSNASVNKDKNNKKPVQIKDSRDMLEFENIEVCNEDVSLINNGNNEYLGVLEIGGISYNLLSQEEKINLEENYGNMLNGIDFPFQIYIQSRKLDLDNYINKYNVNLDKHAKKVKDLEEKYYEDESDIKVKADLDKAKNIYKYASQSVEHFYNTNIASNLLSRKYYIVVKYFHNNSNFENELSDREKLECAYNEVVNKAIAFEDSLTRNGLTCKLLNGLELGELLYTSYNKEDASSLKIRNAIKARYNHLCTTATPIEIKKNELRLEEFKEKKIELEKKIANTVEEISEEYNIETREVAEVIDNVINFDELQLDNYEIENSEEVNYGIKE